ncbi:cytochrome P450 [Streptomyces sp. CA-181903]|uniref:cytochrome P450 n=1 Tax=Streptomyces sp. CA-181903 TaxID=3240055 RepID=UPI003D9264AA
MPASPVGPAWRISLPVHCRDLQPDYRMWRQAGPVQRVEFPDGLRVWAVTRYDDVLALLRADGFTRDWSTAPCPAYGYGVRRHGEDYFAAKPSNLFNSDGTDHQRLLRLVAPFFSRKRIDGLRPFIDSAVDSAVDDVVGQLPERAVDLVAGFAVPVPLRVIGRLIGIRDGLLPALAEHLHVISGWIDPESEPWRHSMLALHRLTLQILREPRPDRDESLIAALLEAHANRGTASRPEIASMIKVLLATGYETTAALLANGALAMVRDPAVRRQLAQGSGAEACIAELLRWRPPSPWGQIRIALRDLTFAGVRIKAGDLVYPLIAAANRDPARFAEPDRLIPDRREATHLSFGRGRRRCLGSPLALAVATAALPELARRLPAVSLSVPVEQLDWHGLMHVRMLQRLPVRPDAREQCRTAGRP